MTCTAIDGLVFIAEIARSKARNAVDGLTAQALADALGRIEADSRRSVAIFAGSDGTACAGADLKPMVDETRRNGLDCGLDAMVSGEWLAGATGFFAVAGRPGTPA